MTDVQVVLSLSEAEAVFLRECLAARDALEVWTGDGVHIAPDGVDDQDLYFRLGGTFDELMSTMTTLAHPRTDSARAVKALWDAAESYRKAAAIG